MRSMKRAVLFAVLVCVSAASQGQEADAPVSPSVAPPLSPAAAESARQAEKIRQLEAEIQNLRDESHAAAESIQDRMDDSNQHLNRVLLIFAAAALLVVLLSAHNIRLRQRAANQRIEESVREAQTLFRDLRRHLAAPEMQHMRVSQSLRELMRRLRDESFAGLSEAQSRMVREAAADMHLPAALHFMAVAMRDEQNGDWEKASAALNRLREMDPDDPDILLHLAHVHAKLAESSPDPKARARNRRLAHQYYTRFTMALRTIKMEDAPAPAPRAYIQIPTPPAPPAPPPKPLEFPEPKIAPAPAVPAPPPTIETVPPPTPTQPTQPTPTQPTHPTQPVASTPSTPSTPPAPSTPLTRTHANRATDSGADSDSEAVATTHPPDAVGATLARADSRRANFTSADARTDSAVAALATLATLATRQTRLRSSAGARAADAFRDSVSCEAEADSRLR